MIDSSLFPECNIANAGFIRRTLSFAILSVTTYSTYATFRISSVFICCITVFRTI